MKKPYVKPSATQLTRQEAKAKLIEYTRKGDTQARQLLELLDRKPSEAEQAERRERSA